MSNGNRRALRWLGALAVLTMIGMSASDASASSKTRKIRKQIRVFEAMVDRMLVESPNWLVRSSEEARGSYVDGHGVIISFDASLVGKHWGSWDHDDDWWDWIWDKDDRVIVIEDESGRTEDIEGGSRRWRDRALKKQERLYTRGKVEITDTILDYGDVLAFAKDDDWLEIEAHLRKAEYFREQDWNTLTMRVKMRDVRAYADGRINEEDLINRIEVEES